MWGPMGSHTVLHGHSRDGIVYIFEPIRNVIKDLEKKILSTRFLN